MELESQMVLFARTVDLGSFSAVSREQKHSPSAVSRQISDLENKIGVRLLTRSSAGIAMTEEGRVFYPRCKEIRQNIAAALDLADSLSEKPEGKLRVNTTVAFGKSQILPALPEFYRRHPKIDISIDFNDRPVDLTTQAIDVAIQFAEQMDDETVIARKLAVNRRIVCAAPSYLERAGGVELPQDLSGHNILRLSTVPKWNDWVVDVCGGDKRIKTKCNLEASSADAIYHAVLAGLGIARLPTYLIEDDITAGRLINLLPCYEDISTNIYAVYLMRRNMSPKVREAPGPGPVCRERGFHGLDAMYKCCPLTTTLHHTPRQSNLFNPLISLSLFIPKCRCLSQEHVS